MKTLSSLAIMMLQLGWISLATAQYEGEIEVPENILEAIRESEKNAEGAANDVTVVLPPPGGTSGKQEEVKEVESAEEPTQDEVVASILNSDSEIDVEITPGSPAPQGPEVRVHPLRDLGGRKITAADVTIRTPFAAKPLGTPTPGWKLVSSPEAPPFSQNVEVAPGTWLTLSIRPHVLIPDADGQTAFQIQEPGFTPAHGYRQTSTIGATLGSSIEQLEADSRMLGEVITDLEQILISLPKSDN